MRYGFVLNSDATGFDHGRGEITQYLQELLRNLWQKGHITQIFETSSRDNIQLLVRNLAADGFERIVAAGGDGTVNGVANGILSSGKNIPLGIVPLGLGNDFARNNGIFGWDEVFQSLLGDRQVSIDVGRLNEAYFLNSASFGFDAGIAKEMQEIRRKSRPRVISKLLLYFFLFLKELVRPKYFWFKESPDGAPQKGLLIAVLNGPSYGKIFNVAPLAKMDDGFLNIHVLKYETRWQAALDVIKFFSGAFFRLAEGPLRVKSLFLQTKGRVSVQIDGEPLRQNEHSYKISVIPGGLIVLRP